MALVYLQMLQQPIHILCHLIDMIAGFRFVRLTMSPDIGSNDAVVLCKLRENPLPHVEVPAAEMKKQNSRLDV